MTSQVIEAAGAESVLSDLRQVYLPVSNFIEIGRQIET
jgi:hypothetical protein